MEAADRPSCFFWLSAQTGPQTASHLTPLIPHELSEFVFRQSSSTGDTPDGDLSADLSADSSGPSSRPPKSAAAAELSAGLSAPAAAELSAGLSVGSSSRPPE